MNPLYQYEDHVLLPAGAAHPISASASVAPPIRASTSTTVVPPVYADETSTLFPSLFGTKLKLCIVHVPGMDRGGLKLVSSAPVSVSMNHTRPWLSSGLTHLAAPP